jgi:hypothetical protein
MEKFCYLKPFETVRHYIKCSIDSCIIKLVLSYARSYSPRSGTYSLGGHVTDCTLCEDFQEQPARGQTKCTNCREGYYSAAGDATCKKCTPDTSLCNSELFSYCQDSMLYIRCKFPRYWMMLTLAKNPVQSNLISFSALTRISPPVPVCLEEQEYNEIYGNYSWPTTLAGESVEIKCFYNVSKCWGKFYPPWFLHPWTVMVKEVVKLISRA